MNRRKFLGFAGFIGVPILASGTNLSKPEGPLFLSPTKAGSLNTNISNTIAKLIETKVICKQPGRFLGSGTEYGLDINGHMVIKKEVKESDRYIGWPTIAKTKDGQLLVAFSGDRDSHVCPWGKTQLIRSMNAGKSWSSPETINNTPLDDRDAGLIQTANGTLLVSWFTSIAFEKKGYRASFERYARVSEKLSPEIRKKWLGNWTRRSTDGGKTWEEPTRNLVSGPHGAVQLKDGKLLYIGTTNMGGKKKIAVEESQDDGISWQLKATIDVGLANVQGLWEPHLVQLKSGKIIAMVRNEPGDPNQCFLLQSESLDGGKTWTILKSSGILGYPPHIIQLKNGTLLVVYTRRELPFGIRACISKDEGKTWDVKNEITLTNSESRDLGYPSSVELNDGSILTVYYQAEVIGHPTCLKSTHWKLT